MPCLCLLKFLGTESFEFVAPCGAVPKMDEAAQEAAFEAGVGYPEEFEGKAEAFDADGLGEGHGEEAFDAAGATITTGFCAAPRQFGG